jgi:hypothetical protein
MWQGVVNHEVIKKIPLYYEKLNTTQFNIQENCIRVLRIVTEFRHWPKHKGTDPSKHRKHKYVTRNVMGYASNSYLFSFITLIRFSEVQINVCCSYRPYFSFTPQVSVISFTRDRINYKTCSRRNLS